MSHLHLQALKTYEEFERYHYITNSPFHHMYASMQQMEDQVCSLQEEVGDLEERIDDLEQEKWAKEND